MLRRACAHACLVGSVVASGCGDDGGSTAGSGGGGVVTPDFDVGGDRPTTVRVPTSYRAGEPAPLVILLHGYGATGFLEDTYLELSQAALERGVLFAAPDGTRDSKDRTYWNATEACCNFEGTAIDDSAYLIGLVDEIAAKVDVDPKRVFFAGHSNGAFMSHRMACDHSDRVAAIAALSGMNHLDPGDCGATEPVSVLQIHGTADDEIQYGGGDNLKTDAGFPGSAAGPYPSVDATLATWIMIDGCDASPTSGEPLDLDVSLDGFETTVSTYGGCDGGAQVELWAIQGGSHIPLFYYYVAGNIMDQLLAHPKE